ncbi:hypothetical protein RHSIM_Rhsim01G0044100 [Rhododendron simsii]|uniref:Uncharacterized protein n=1 Tax=Rhododendron simsii TaxID=118357 RepID=A0A834M202_RHOSS|nr:hypothetical protein RHSIM_Rhsim01G0044100 [Rhododendron simsii]
MSATSATSSGPASGNSSSSSAGPLPNGPHLASVNPSNTKMHLEVANVSLFVRGFTEYKVHSYSRNGLCVVGFMDDHYPVRSAFSLLNQLLDEYQKNFGDSWRTVQADSTQPWPYLNEALTKFQDPAEADKLLKIQRELDETKIILHKTIDSVLARGERLDSLVEKSSDLSAASQYSEEVNRVVFLVAPKYEYLLLVVFDRCSTNRRRKLINAVQYCKL